MLWEVLSRRIVLHSKSWSLARDFTDSKLLECRPLATIGPTEQTPLWDPLLSERNTQHRNNAVPPKNDGVVIQSPPKAPTDRGVIINKRGQLQVTSRADAEKECCTALILSAASTNLTKADFIRLVPENDRMREDCIQGPSP